MEFIVAIVLVVAIGGYVLYRRRKNASVTGSGSRPGGSGGVQR